MEPPLCSTRSRPLRTTVYSSKSGVWPGSIQPPGLRMWAMLSSDVSELTRPIYSSINFGFVPGVATLAGFTILCGLMTVGSHLRRACYLLMCLVDLLLIYNTTHD